MKLENAGIFQGFAEHHLPNAYLKTTLEEAWEENEKFLHYTCEHKFRTPLDENQCLYRNKQLAQGKFYPVSRKSRGKYVFLKGEISSIIEDILNGAHKMLCINDVPGLSNYEEIFAAVISVYEQKLPNKSAFEK